MTTELTQEHSTALRMRLLVKGGRNPTKNLTHDSSSDHPFAIPRRVPGSDS